jgi:enamine deaminase RidA (YjgF/YER057c/UK114 family)
MKMIQGLAEEQRLSGAIVQGGLVWLAGRVADDDSPDRGQTADVLRQVDALLEQAGTHKRRPLSVTAVLADVRDAPAVNRPWDGSPDPATKPARTTVEAALVAPSWPVGITGVAALDGPGARQT